MNRLSSGRDTRSLPILLLCMLVLFNVVSSIAAGFLNGMSAQNVMVSGNIIIHQHEQERVTDENGATQLQNFTHYQRIAPLVQVGAAGMEKVSVGSHEVLLRNSSASNYVDRIVTVENVGMNPVYVRTFVAVPTGGLKSNSPEDANWLRFDAYTDGSWSWKNGEEWHLIDDADIGGVPYDIYIATHSRMLVPGEISAPSLLGFYVDSSLSNDDSGRYYLDTPSGKEYLDLLGMEILVATQATQTTFDTAQAALNTVFGEPALKNHPWANENITFISNDTELHAVLQAAIEKGEARTLWLQDGIYTLPGALPSGTRIIGHGRNVVIQTSGSVTGSGMEFNNVTFANNVSFTGSGEFDNVTFQGTFHASFHDPAYITNCIFMNSFGWSVTENADRSAVVFENCTNGSGEPVTAQ